MARYTYNASLVTQTLDKLYSACDSLDSTNVDIKKGIDMINNARGAENISIDYTPITGYQSSVIDYIETMASEIKKKAQEIEEYQDAPWYKKLFATIGMGALKLVEGLASFVEQVGDGLVAITGFIGGIFSSKFRDCLGEFVKKDWVGDTTAKWYEEGWLKSVNKYSIMSHESTAANVLKGIGVAAGYVVLTVCTYGAGTAVSLGVSAAAAAAGGIGSGTQSGLQAGMTFNQAFGQGVKQGAVAAATTLVVGGVANKLGAITKGASSVLNSADEVTGALVNSSDEIANALVNSGDEVANALVNSGDEITNAALKVADKADETFNAITKTADKLDDAGVTIKNAQIGDKVKMGDDMVEVIGKKITKEGDEILKVRGSHGTDALRNVNGKLTSMVQGDDVYNIVANSGDEVANAIVNNADEVGTALINNADEAGTALRVIDKADEAGTALKVVDKADEAGNALKVVDKVDDGANAAAKAGKTTIGQKITNVYNKSMEKLAQTVPGKAVGTAANAIGPAGTNAVASVAGAAAGGNLSAPAQSSANRIAMNEAANPTPGQQLAEESYNKVMDNKPTINENPQVSGGANNGGAQSGNGSSSTTPNAGGDNGGKPSYQVTGKDPVKLPDYPGGDGGNNGGNGGNNGGNGGNNGTDGAVGGVDITGGNGGGGGTSGTSGNGSTHGIKTLGKTTTGKVSSSDVLDTFGAAAGSLSDITGTSTSIPSSSSPILSSDGGSGSSMIPLGAGLGAAALAGIGTKAYLDKKEKKEEDSDELETEEWANQDVEIDYGLETDEEADYLDPTDELAFQE